MREWRVRFYIDADILGLARVVSPLRGDITFPGDPGAVVHKRWRPPCEVTSTATPDTEWVPVTARNQWIVITRDLNIRENVAERRAVRESGARMVALGGEDAKTKWGQLELFFKWWRRIEALQEISGPFIHLVTRTRFTALDLDD